MTFEEKIKAYEAQTERIDACGRAIRNILIGVGALITALTGLVTVLIH